MAERDLIVRIIGDEKDLVRAFNRSEREAKSFKGTVTGATAGLGTNFVKAGVAAGAAAISFQAVGAALGEAISDASNLNEQLSKSREVFGDSAQDIETWSKTTSSAFGISQQAALEATGTFGNLFKTVDLAPAQAAEMSRALVELTADLASFNNASPADVLLAIQSGLIGEAEPLRRYGVLLSEARVQQRALADTGKDNVRALTNQEKAIARFEIIMGDTAAAQGDFERTSDSLANQTRILQANIDDLSAHIGSGLIPVLTDATTAANLLFIALGKLKDVKLPEFDIPGLPEVPKLPGGGTPGVPGVNLPSPEQAIPMELRVLFGWAGNVKKLIDSLESDDKDAQNAIDTFKAHPDTIDKLDAYRAEQAAKAAAAAKNMARSKTKFAAFTKGMGLKLDKAQLTASFDDDLAALAELERAILRQIRVEGKTFDLVQQLVDVRLARSAIMESRASASAGAVSDAWANTLGFLELDLDKAIEAANFKDQLAAVAAIENAILAQIAKEGKTLELMRDLFDIRKQRADLIEDETQKKKERREAKVEARKARQFEILGLTGEGEERAPGLGALKKRLGTLREQVKGTILDTPKTQREFARIAKVLAQGPKNVGREMRLAILQMYADISGALDDGGKNVQITKFAQRGIDQVIKGLGLTTEQAKALQQRMSSVGSGGIAATGAGRAPAPDIPRGAGRGDVIVHGDLIVQNPRDADDIVKQIQRKGGRSASSRRGPRPAVNRGGI